MTRYDNQFRGTCDHKASYHKYIAGHHQKTGLAVVNCSSCKGWVTAVSLKTGEIVGTYEQSMKRQKEEMSRKYPPFIPRL